VHKEHEALADGRARRLFPRSGCRGGSKPETSAAGSPGLAACCVAQRVHAESARAPASNTLEPPRRRSKVRRARPARPLDGLRRHQLDQRPPCQRARAPVPFAGWQGCSKTAMINATFRNSPPSPTPSAVATLLFETTENQPLPPARLGAPRNLLEALSKSPTVHAPAGRGPRSVALRWARGSRARAVADRSQTVRPRPLSRRLLAVEGRLACVRPSTCAPRFCGLTAGPWCF